MTETEKAYIAGEGSIILKRIHKNENPAPCISTALTTIELLEWIKLTIGKGIISKKKKAELIITKYKSIIPRNGYYT